MSRLCRWTSGALFFSGMYRYKCKSGFKPDFTNIHRVVLFLHTFTSPKSPRFTSSSYDFFWNQTRCPKSFFFSFYCLKCFSIELKGSCGRACFSPLSTVVGCLWGVGWIMEGISVGFQRNKEDCFFLNHWRASPVASTNHNARRPDVALSGVCMHL